MFRISKSDDPIDRRDPEDETADRHSSPTGAANTVASTALRWLRGPQSTQHPQEPQDPPSQTWEDPGNPPRFGLFKPATEDGRATDDEGELELAQPLDPDDFDVGDEAERDLSEDGFAALAEDEPASEEASMPDVAEPVDSPDGVAADPAGQAIDPAGLNGIPLEIDDEDDLDDFDELVTIDRAIPAVSLEAVPFHPDIDSDDASSADDLDVPLPPAPVAADVEVKPTATSVDAELAQPALRSPSKPAVSERPESAAPETIGKPSAKLDEAPIRPFDASLSLQPIPELQTRSEAQTNIRSRARSSTPAPRQPVASDSDEVANSLANGPAEGDEADGAPLRTPIVDMWDDDGFDAPPTTDDDPIEIYVTDLEPSDSDEPPLLLADDVDDDGGDDRLSDVLLHDDEGDHHPSAAGHDQQPGVLPLSKTLAHIAATGEPEPSEPAFEITEPDDADFLPPALLPAPPQRKPDAQLPTTLPTDEADLSPAQLALGIITNVPRLRRFAAALIGEELEADRLVQITVKSALADPSVLQPIADLGRALIVLLHQRRLEMLNAPAALPRLADAAHAFEAVLCRALAGADQFEIHQFARAINGLDEPDRDVLLLVSLENFTYDQVAEIVQMPIERVMATVSGARMRLRQTLAADDAADDVRQLVIDGPHPRETEIHGYLDGELDSYHMAEVDALVERDEDAADRLLNYGIQGDLIRRLYAPLLNRPIPGAMLGTFWEAAKSSQQRRVFPFGPRKALIASAITIALGAAATWLHAVPNDSDDRQSMTSMAALEQHEVPRSVI